MEMLIPVIVGVACLIVGAALCYFIAFSGAKSKAKRLLAEAEAQGEVMKKNKLLELVTLGSISVANFQSMTEACDREVAEAEKSISELEESLFTKEEFKNHIAEIKLRLDAAAKDASDGMITNEFVAHYIDKILVSIINDDTAKLEIKIFTGKNTEKWLKKLASHARNRTGDTLLTI